ncbi:MAG: DUF4846 domain-containing protein [Hyphomicrobiaceae bacterium]
MAPAHPGNDRRSRLGSPLAPEPRARRGSGRRLVAALAGLLALAATPAVAGSDYPWHDSAARPADTLSARVPPPAGFRRVPAPAGSFAAWLRGLPMKPAGAPVRLHTGALKGRQDVHVAVVDIDVGRRDLQQCADAIMRLRAEWLRATGKSHLIAFNDTGGGRPMSYARWAAGERPRVSGRSLAWSRRAAPDQSYAAFRRYMDVVFSYAGTHSLARELKSARVDTLAVGDIFIKGGFPGHAVLVADLAEHPGTGERRFLLVQSYMPAQDIHVLKDPKAADGSPWYPLDFGLLLVTPEWTFPRTSLKRW